MGKIKKPIYSTSNEDKLEKTSIVLGSIPYAGSVISGSIQRYLKKRQEERLNEFLLDMHKDLQEVKNRINLDYTRSVSKTGENLPIKEVLIEGNTVFSCKEIRKIMILQEGQIFSHKIFKNDLTQIYDLYKNRGYPLANIEDTFFDKKGKLFIKISEGRIEKILIKGNIKIGEKVIAREVNVFPGDLFFFKKIRKSLQKIYSLGYFEDVTLRLEPSNKKELVILIINVFEKNNRI